MENLGKFLSVFYNLSFSCHNQCMLAGCFSFISRIPAAAAAAMKLHFVCTVQVLYRLYTNPSIFHHEKLIRRTKNDPNFNIYAIVIYPKPCTNELIYMDCTPMQFCNVILWQNRLYRPSNNYHIINFYCFIPTNLKTIT